MPMLRTLTFLFAMILPSVSMAETYLLMAEERGCMWCAQWTRELGHIYPKTPEGQAAPLRRYDIHGDPPENLSLLRKVVFTPTFILVNDGQEIGRIEGYPGEDFFWALLSQMIERAGIPMDVAG